jgi:hypothetical protein
MMVCACGERHLLPSGAHGGGGCLDDLSPLLTGDGRVDQNTDDVPFTVDDNVTFSAKKSQPSVEKKKTG